MRLTLLEVLGCPRCHGELDGTATEADGDDIRAGLLRCARCDRSYPIRAGIPRFVEADGYAASFGYQWHRFRSEQLDSRNGTSLSRKSCQNWL